MIHTDPCISRFKDEYGNVQKELPHPSVAHMLYEFLPLIDEHNKARQNSLDIEKHWLTKMLDSNSHDIFGAFSGRSAKVGLQEALQLCVFN